MGRRGQAGRGWAATLRRRRGEWIAAGVFDTLVEEAIAAYDRIRSLDLAEVSIDGSLRKAACAGEATGPNPTDRAQRGWKWSLATDAAGIPIGWSSTAPTVTTFGCSSRPWMRSAPAAWIPRGASVSRMEC